MAEIRKSSTSLSSQMTVLEEGKNVARPSSGGAVKRNVKKMPSEGLLVLSPEPVPVQFEEIAVRPTSAGSRSENRVGSAGHVERKLQMARKKVLNQDEAGENSAGARLSIDSGSSATEESLSQSAAQLHLTNKDVSRRDKLTEDKKDPQNEPSVSKESEEDSESDSSDTSSGTEESSDEETSMGAGVGQHSQSEATVELKGEFLKCVMDEDYEKAQELCKKILLLEPDNVTCQEFHGVINQKIKQDEEEEEEEGDEEDEDEDEDSEEESDDSDDDDEEEGSDEESDEDEDDNEDEDEDESDEDFALPPGPINLLMGGLPVRPQQS